MPDPVLMSWVTDDAAIAAALGDSEWEAEALEALEALCDDAEAEEA